MTGPRSASRIFGTRPCRRCDGPADGDEQQADVDEDGDGEGDIVALRQSAASRCAPRLAGWPPSTCWMAFFCSSRSSSAEGGILKDIRP